MKVLKFGGTSIGSAERMKHVAELIQGDEKQIIVLSAMSGTTNSLVKINESLAKGQVDEALQIVDKMKTEYENTVNNLYQTEKFRQKGIEIINVQFDFIFSVCNSTFTETEEKKIIARGELLSTNLFNNFLHEQQIDSVLLSALDFMRIDNNGVPVNFYIEEILKRELDKYNDAKIFITQGFICLNSEGVIDNLERGGSDYTASLIGRAVKAAEIQIWTDISGIQNNDPRYVEKTCTVPHVSFEEAAELAYFGAKILHPLTILPANTANIPVRLKNTLDPKHPGTLISNKTESDAIKAVAAKDEIIAVKIKSARMLMAYGFLRQVFEVFERYKTSIDMITTSEIAVSLTIDNVESIEDIKKELENFGSVEIDKDHSIICVVGDFIASRTGMANRVTEALKDIPIRMISYGGSRHNISILIDTENKKEALNALSKSLFSGKQNS